MNLSARLALLSIALLSSCHTETSAAAPPSTVQWEYKSCPPIAPAPESIGKLFAGGLATGFDTLSGGAILDDARAKAAEGDQDAIQQVERIEAAYLLIEEAHQEYADRLNEFGSEGWELVTENKDRMLFKRPKR